MTKPKTIRNRNSSVRNLACLISMLFRRHATTGCRQWGKISCCPRNFCIALLHQYFSSSRARISGHSCTRHCAEISVQSAYNDGHVDGNMHFFSLSTESNFIRKFCSSGQYINLPLFIHFFLYSKEIFCHFNSLLV